MKCNQQKVTSQAKKEKRSGESSSGTKYIQGKRTKVRERERPERQPLRLTGGDENKGRESEVGRIGIPATKCLFLSLTLTLALSLFLSVSLCKFAEG